MGADEMRRPARRLMAFSLLVLAAAGVACGDEGAPGGASPSDAAVVDVSEVLDRSGFHEADFVDRRGSLLQLTIRESGELVQLDLAQFAVFDCRSSCTSDIRASLAPVGRQDRFCIGPVWVEDGLTHGKIWVDRPTC